MTSRSCSESPNSCIPSFDAASAVTPAHWLTHSDGLFLVHTRKDPSNINVIRWRASLFMARVDPETLRLERASERVVAPLVGDGVNDPDQVAVMGNFHVTNASSTESWVTVGEWLPRGGIRGNLLLARILWKQPNQQSVASAMEGELSTGKD